MSSQTPENRTPLLRVHNLNFSYPQSVINSMLKRERQPHSTPFSLKGVSLEIYPNEALGLIGESTCGKSTLGKIMIQLLQPDTDGGLIEFNGDGFKDKGHVLKYTRKALHAYRQRVQMIFQNPDASLNPGMRVKDLIMEAIQACPKKRYTPDEINAVMKEYLQMMNLRGRESDYPDILSGGEKRRVGIIRVLAMKPDLIIADEPFANLDVSLRNYLINIFQQLKTENQLSFLFILHEIEVASYLCDRIAVMYLGRIVEIGPTQQLFAKEGPKHPYTEALITALAVLKGESVANQGLELLPLTDTPSGCPYRNRCRRYQQLTQPEQLKCQKENPDLNQVEENHKIACHFWQR
ncbi:ABC transporter ATP-binding protein [Candidatus Poribacteria bacterium]|nr:ABC transporter ATP-binding protein [Candidatus Poribacteria bacterium]